MTDRRFSRNKFGDGALFGPSDARPGNVALAWDVSIDWDGNGTFDYNEATYLQGVDIKRGRQSVLKKGGQGFESFRTGSAVLRLSNDDGRFDAWNTESPLYPIVGYGKDVRIRVRDMIGGSIYKLMRGKIVNIVPSGYGSRKQVTIYVNDGLDYLRNTPAGFSLETDITPGEAIAITLGAAGWQGGSIIDTDVETIGYCWSSDNRKAMAILEELSNSFMGYFFCNNDNKARFISRSSVGDLVASYAQEFLLKDIDNPMPADISRNITRLKLHPRQQSATTTVWNLVGQPYEVLTGASNERFIFCSYSYNNTRVPATNVAIVDFEANTQSNFLGTDKTAQCSTSFSNLGETGKVGIVNNSGGTVFCRFSLEGVAIYETYTADITYPVDTTTVSSPRELILDLPWQQDPNTGRDIASVMGAFFAALHPSPHIKIENRPGLQYGVDLMDIVSADIGKLGLIGESFRIGGIEHKTLTENCQSVVTDLYLEPYVGAGDFMQWDTHSDFDDTTVFGY